MDGIFAVLLLLGLVWFVHDVMVLRQRQKRLRNSTYFGPGRCLHCNEPVQRHSPFGRCEDGSGNFYT